MLQMSQAQEQESAPRRNLLVEVGILLSQRDPGQRQDQVQAQIWWGIYRPKHAVVVQNKNKTNKAGKQTKPHKNSTVFLFKGFSKNLCAFKNSVCRWSTHLTKPEGALFSADSFWWFWRERGGNCLGGSMRCCSS